MIGELIGFGIALHNAGRHWSKNKEDVVVYRIRKNSLVEDDFLDRTGKWTTWERAAKFRSVSALEPFATKCGVEVYGIF